MTLLFPTVNCLPSHMCIHVILQNQISEDCVAAPAFGCSLGCLGVGCARIYLQPSPKSTHRLSPALLPFKSLGQNLFSVFVFQER